MLATTRTLVRRAAMATASAIVPAASNAAATACNASRSIATATAFRSPPAAALMGTPTRAFSTLPTDSGSDDDNSNSNNTSESESKNDDAEHSPTEGIDKDTSTNINTTDGQDESNKATIDNDLNKNLKPSEIVAALDRHIVGQPDAKKSVAIAMRNRWRRRQLPDDLRKEVTPRNVLLVGPTG